MDILFWIVAGAVVVAAIAFIAAPRREVVTEIGIEAEPDRVWAVLTDTAAHAAWNPFIVSMKGTIEPGGILENTMQPGGGSPMTFRPTILTVRPERELRWLGRLFLPRIFDGEHYFLLEPGEGGTRLIHGETFRGIALWVMDVERFRADFEAMNAALKQRAESL